MRGAADRKYIAGVVMGDGMVYHRAKTGYEVKITDKNEAYIKYLADLISAVYGITPRVAKDPLRNAWRLRAFKKALYLQIKRDIEWAKGEPDSHVVGGLYDAEGYWNPKKRKLAFTNKEVFIIKLVSQFLSGQNISHSVYQRKKGQYSWYVIEVHKQQALRLMSILDLRHPKWGVAPP
ncbi:hypothetical protein CGL52_13695 [Pyrobaculum aerophilum]|uniref:Homing endonuclease LAGLIDADG domain-containing protein n=1 Tax=Pyrobaculum aerophilum TaxID=13773 RepID=A0A371QX02_9CREN|nr:hypothetical protein CGL52_13695 [Pyrobaculum aerophilum]